MAKILIVDDEQSILETLEMFLGEKGHEVYTASTGEKGFTLFCQLEPEVVILDIRLPDQNGLDILSHQWFDQTIQSPIHHRGQVMKAQFDPMVSHAVLREIIGPDLLVTLPGADLSLPGRCVACVFLGDLLIQ